MLFKKHYVDRYLLYEISIVFKDFEFHENMQRDWYLVGVWELGTAPPLPLKSYYKQSLGSFIYYVGSFLDILTPLGPSPILLTKSYVVIWTFGKLLLLPLPCTHGLWMTPLTHNPSMGQRQYLKSYFRISIATYLRIFWPRAAWTIFHFTKY